MHVSGDSFFLNESESGLIGTAHFGFVECGGDWMAYCMIDSELICAASHPNAGIIGAKSSKPAAAGYRAEPVPDESTNFGDSPC